MDTEYRGIEELADALIVHLRAENLGLFLEFRGDGQGDNCHFVVVVWDDEHRARLCIRSKDDNEIVISYVHPCKLVRRKFTCKTLVTAREFAKKLARI